MEFVREFKPRRGGITQPEFITAVVVKDFVLPNRAVGAEPMKYRKHTVVELEPDEFRKLASQGVVVRKK